MNWLFPQKQKTPAEQSCLGIELHYGRPYAVLIRKGEVAQSYLPQASEQGLADLEQWLRTHQLANIPVVISLDEADYQLHLVEAPPVADAELADALRFRMRDLLNTDSGETLLQAFRLPQDAYRGRMDMVFAAVTERSVIAELVRWCRRVELDLRGITIGEISLLNLIAGYEPESAVGVLRLDDSEGMIYLLREGALYLSRRVNIGAQALQTKAEDDGSALSLNNDAPIDALALEIQRSLDYFDSQIGMGVVSQLWVLLPDKGDVRAALPQLEKSVNTPVRLFTPGRSAPAPEGMEMTASQALAWGNALLSQQEVAG